MPATSVPSETPSPPPPADDAPQLPSVRAWLPLLREGLAREGRFRWQLQGTSMLPTLEPGWEIEVVPLPPRVPLGALIVFAQGSDLVAHRLIYRRTDHWVAQGDNRPGPDPQLAPEDVLGLVRTAYHGHVHVWPRRGARLAAWRWVARAFGLAFGRRARRLLR